MSSTAHNQAPAIVAITSQVPWPLDGGGHLRTFYLLRALAKTFRVILVTSSAGEEREAIAALAEAGVGIRLARLPARTAIRAGLQVLDAAVKREPYVLYRRHWHKETAALFAATIAAERPDIVYLDHLDSAVYRDLGGRHPVVVDLHNVYSTLVDRLANDQGSLARRLFLRREARLLAKVERGALAAADLVFAVSQVEADHFAGIGAHAIELVPNGVDCSVYGGLPAGRPPSASPVILYTGTLSWEPNAESARFLATSVLPEVRRRIPDAALEIVGRAPSDALKMLNELPGVSVHADVPSLLPYLERAHVVAVPLSSGGGTRLKILEAFAAGVPVVSTAIGCEGLQVADGRDLVVAERDVFAQQVVALLTDTARAARLAAMGRALAQRTYDWPVVGHIASTAVERLIDRRQSAVVSPDQAAGFTRQGA